MTEIETIDITPTWSALLPAMLDVIANHSDTREGFEAAENIRGEFQKMAKAADLYRGQLYDHFYSVSRDGSLADERPGEYDEGHIFCTVKEGEAIASGLEAALGADYNVSVEPGGDYDFTTEDGGIGATTTDEIVDEILQENSWGKYADA